MSLKTFIAAHRAEIDNVINSVIYRYDGKGGKGTIPNPPPTHNDQERRNWIMNDESLYNWARSEKTI